MTVLQRKIEENLVAQNFQLAETPFKPITQTVLKVGESPLNLWPHYSRLNRYTVDFARMKLEKIETCGIYRSTNIGDRTKPACANACKIWTCSCSCTWCYQQGNLGSRQSASNPGTSVQIRTADNRAVKEWKEIDRFEKQTQENEWGHCRELWLAEWTEKDLTTGSQ